MADTGLPWSLPYPLPDDPPDGPGAVQGLANKVAAGLGYAYPCTSTTHPAPTAGRIIAETDTGQMLFCADGVGWQPLALGDDTGWLDMALVGWVALNSYALTSGKVLRRNGFVSLYASLTSPGALSTGDYANQSVMQAPAGYIPGYNNGGFGGGPNGSFQCGYISTGGVVVIPSGGGMTAGATLQVTGTYGL